MKERRRLRPTWATAVGLIVALGGPPVLAAMSRGLAGGSPNLALEMLFQSAFCGLAVFVVLLVVHGERLSLRSIGLRRPDWSTASTALLLFVAGLLVQSLIIGPLVKVWAQPGANAGVATLAALPAWFRIALGASSGVVEETLYRGYAVERLVTITGYRWLGATLATVAFAAAHIPVWGLKFALVADLPAGIVLVAFYLWRRDLVANMVAHSGGIVLAMFTIVRPAE